MNTLPKTIMACIDLSDYSPMTLGYALELAKIGYLGCLVFLKPRHLDIGFHLVGTHGLGDINGMDFPVMHH